MGVNIQGSWTELSEKTASWGVFNGGFQCNITDFMTKSETGRLNVQKSKMQKKTKVVVIGDFLRKKNVMFQLLQPFLFFVTGFMYYYPKALDIYLIASVLNVHVHCITTPKSVHISV